MIRSAVRHDASLSFRQPVARDRVRFRLTTATDDVESVTVEYFKRSVPGNRFSASMTLYAADAENADWYAEIPFPEEAHYIKYYFRIRGEDGEEWCFCEYGFSAEPPATGFFELLQVNRRELFDAPDWARGAIWYQIFPERFEKSGRPALRSLEPWSAAPTRDNFLGGDLRGIISRLTYLEELGIECLYLNPVFRADFNHKYATTDYFSVDPDFGTDGDLTELVREAHRRGIRVVLDGVFNHCGTGFAPFADVCGKGTASEYTDWFLIREYPVRIDAACYECVGDYPYMPRLNTAGPEVMRFIVKVMEYWIDRAGIDGWRLDVADELDNTCLEYIRMHVRRHAPDTLLLGETWGDAGRMVNENDKLDCAMNYLFRDAVLDYYARDAITTRAFRDRVGHMLRKYPPDTMQCMYNCIGSHDTPRFLTECGGEKWRLRLAMAFQMLSPGSPAIYYGDETGMTGENDPGCRGGMNWTDPDRELIRWEKQLIRWRKEHPAIRTGRYAPVTTDDAGQVFGFVRENGNERILVLINKGNEAVTKDFAGAGKPVTVLPRSVEINII